MAIIAKLIEKRSNRDPLSDYWYYPFSSPAISGVEVNESTSLNYSVVWACRRVISETIASLPLFVYRRLPDSGKEKAPDHRLYDILHIQPNPEMTSMQYREVAVDHVLSWGNHYGQIIMSGGGWPQSIWPLDPSRMTVKRGYSGDLEYHYRQLEGGTKVFRADEILHVPGLGFNGIIGYSVIERAKNSIGLGMGLEEFQNRFLVNDGSPGGVLEHPNKLSTQAQDNLKKSWAEAHSGLPNKWKPAILEEGMKWHEVGIPLKDAQFLESRKFQVVEICRWFNIAPYKVQDFDRSTFSNVEQASIDFVVHTIRPWLVRFEQAYQVKLFSSREKNKYFAEHLVDGLLRGDIQSRYAAYAIGRNWGWLNADQICERENMNPLPDGKGKIYLQPLNMVEAGTSLAPPQPTESFKRLLDDAMTRAVRRETRDIKEAVRKKALSIAWVEGFYMEFCSFLSRTLSPVVQSYFEISSLNGHSEMLSNVFLKRFCESYAQESKRELIGTLRIRSGEMILDKIDEWILEKSKFKTDEGLKLLSSLIEEVKFNANAKA
jgi:HK97 family phage portal protein